MKKSKATEALRVATDVAAIRAALHQRGYQLLDALRARERFSDSGFKQ
jgi:hypothetical protein